MSDVYKDITLVIPTFNRYHLLYRALKCYQAYGPVCPVIILDSSTDPLDKDLFREFLDPPHYRFVRFDEKIYPLAKMHQGLKEVKSPFVVFCADDDFLVTPSLVPGVKFLKEHREYSLVQGSSFTFRAHPENGIEAVAVYPQRSVEAETASQRYLDHLARFNSTMYSIHRIEDAVRNYGLQDQHQFGWQLQELGLSALSVIQGKTHKLKNLYMFRDSNEVYNGSWDTKLKTKDFFDLVVSPEFETRYQSFKDCLAREIVRFDRISLEAAQDIVKQGLWLNLKANLELKYRQKYLGSAKASLRHRLKTKIKTQKHFFGYAKKLDGLVSKFNDETLSGLLNQRSLYHRDFMPIYEAVKHSGMVAV